MQRQFLIDAVTEAEDSDCITVLSSRQNYLLVLTAMVVNVAEFKPVIFIL